MAYRQIVFARRRVSPSGTYRRILHHQSSTNSVGSASQHLSDSANTTDISGRSNRQGALLEHGISVWRGLSSPVSTGFVVQHASNSSDTEFKGHGSRQGTDFTSWHAADSRGNATDSRGYGSRQGALLKHGCRVWRGLGLSLPVLDSREKITDSRALGIQEPFIDQGLRLWRWLAPNDGKTTMAKGGSQIQRISHFHTFARQSSTSASTVRNAVQYQEDETNPEQGKKPKKLEPSAEECDQAVVGLSSAKAKAKKVQEMESKGVGILHKLWSGLLGIGPALKAVATMSREDWAKKLGHWKEEIRDTLKHYWVGTKLLWADVRISSRLLLKLAGGKSLTRRERQQLTRTTADIFRLVPFAVFVIVPFMEFLLPVFLKLFPNMLPSTFQDKMKEQEALKRKLNARIQYAKFLQETVKEMAKEIKTTRSGEVQRTAEDLDQFMNKVRRGETVSNDEILGFAKLFNDELTLDNISRPRLVSMCKYMGIKAYGTDAYLRHMLRSKLSWIKNDDRMIQAESVESLSEAELRAACRERGMLGLLSVEQMRLQLKDWLDLSLNYSVPSSLLLLSRAFTVSGKMKPEEAVQATLSSLPDEVVESVGFTALPSEDALAERMRKLEYLQKQEELIKEETEKEEVQQGKMKKEVETGGIDRALQDMKAATAREAQELAVKKLSGKQEDLCKLSSALAVLASASSVSKERAEFLRLVNKEIALYNEMVEKEGTKGALEARKAYQAAHEDRERSASKTKVSTALVERIDAMLQNLEKELDDVDAVIGDRWKLLDRDSDGKVTPEEVAAAAMFLKDSLGQEPVQELISNLAKDKEGKILVEDIVKLGTTIEPEETSEEGEKQHQ